MMKKVSAFWGLLILMVGMMMPQEGWGQKRIKNTVSVDILGGPKYFGAGLNYSYDLNPYFGVVANGSLGIWTTDIDELNRGKLQGKIYGIGLGGECRPQGKVRGIYFQVLLRYVNLDILANGREARGDSSWWWLLGLPFKDYDTYSFREDRNTFSLAGKIGYRLVDKNEKIYIAPFITLLQNPFQDRAMVLSNSEIPNTVEIDSAELMKFGGITFGCELGYRF